MRYGLNIVHAVKYKTHPPSVRQVLTMGGKFLFKNIDNDILILRCVNFMKL